MSGGKHADDDTDGVINRLDTDAAAYEGSLALASWGDDGPIDVGEPFIDELGEVHWPAPYFTGEWAGAHAFRLATLPRGAAAPAGLTAETLRAGMGGPLSPERYRQLLPAFTRFLVAAGCTTVNRAAMAFAQLGHEAVGLKYNRELWGPSAQQRKYEPGTDLARQLGNTQRGDGFRYRGGGWIQTTGRGNFGKVSRWAFEHGYVPTPTFFLDNPDLLGDDRYVWIGPTWYWTVARPDINALCDRGDLDTVTRRINGGLTGIDDRRRRWNACRVLGAALLPAPGTSPAAPPPPGGIETMGFRDRFKDWAGNDQTVESWMNNIDRRVAGIADLLLTPSLRSRVDGKNYTPAVFMEATHGDVNAGRDLLEDRVERVERKVDGVLEQQAKILAALEKK